MSQPRHLRIGIVGCGVVATGHIRALRACKGVSLVAVCDQDIETAARVARDYGISRVYAHRSELFAAEQLDAVHITTPPHTHSRLCHEAIDAGCHVLVEKPVSLTTSELDGLLSASQERSLKLCGVHNGLFQPVFVRARQLVERGKIGSIRAIHITDCVPADLDMLRHRNHWCHALPGGIFGEMLAHPLYLANAFLPHLEVANVHSAKLGSVDWILKDELRVLLRTESAVVTLELSVNGMAWEKTIDIVGTAGNIRLDRTSGILELHQPARTWNRASHASRNATHCLDWLSQTAAMSLRAVLGRYDTGHRALVRRFVDSVRQDCELPVTTNELREVTLLYEMVTTAI